jgi:trans-aconitate 2-methyltransferase
VDVEGESRSGDAAASDWDPATYGRVNSLQRLLAERALADLVLSGDEDVLDVGCGDGRVTAMVCRGLTEGSLVGVDPSASMIARARELLALDTRARFEVGTAAALPFVAAFDLVTSFNALHWETRWRDALVRIRAALRPGGRALLVFVCDGERPSLEDVVVEVSTQGPWAAAFEGFDVPYVHVDPQTYGSAAEVAGLRVDSISVDDVLWDFGGREAFADWCAAGLVAWTGRLPEDRRLEFVQSVVDAYARVTGSDARLRFLQCRVRLTAASP